MTSNCEKQGQSLIVQKRQIELCSCVCNKFWDFFVSDEVNRITKDLLEILFHSSKQIQHFNRLELCFVKNWWCEVIKKFYDLVQQ